MCFNVSLYFYFTAFQRETLEQQCVCVVCFRCIVYHLETRMRKDVCFGVIALTWVLSAVLASPLAIFREYGSFTLGPGHTIQVRTHSSTVLSPPSPSVSLIFQLIPRCFISTAGSHLPLFLLSFPFCVIFISPSSVPSSYFSHLLHILLYLQSSQF